MRKKLEICEKCRKSIKSAPYRIHKQSKLYRYHFVHRSCLREKIISKETGRKKIV